MKNMKTKLFIVALSAVFIFLQTACETESKDVKTADELVIDTSVSYTFSERIDTVVYASLWGSILTDYKIDLNNDLTDDIEFSCNVYHHLVYDEWYAGVRTLNETVTLDVEQDTNLIANYSLVYINPSTSDSITFIYNENYDPLKQYPSNLTINSLIETYPVIHSAGDSLNPFCNWKSGAFVLEFDDHMQGEIRNDIKTGIWRNTDKKFVGVRFLENSISYYGWIELGVRDYHITLYKYALQVK
jgi:hypothetical protein